ncbi:hypothetical protein [Streptomyces sp. NPDC002553]|uniref:hypothetical protein n=1 Tax=Streptomyces sp. NPDC002553 TaxID=3154417 RepID=UPI00331BC32A
MPTTACLRRTVARPFQGVGRQVAFLATGVLIQLGVLLVMALPWTLFVPAATWAVLLAVLVPLSAAVAAGALVPPAPAQERAPWPRHPRSRRRGRGPPERPGAVRAEADADHRRVLAVLRFLGVS